MNAVTHPSLAPAAVVVRRIIAAPADDLFDAWLDPEALAEWMRPGAIQRSEARTDPRVGGEYEVVMHGEKNGDRYGSRTKWLPEKARQVA